jgi:uncharacterized protein YecT (DUF1311 family)
MRIFVLAALFSIGAFAAEASPPPEVKAAVEKCLAGKEKAGKPAEECIGAAADACLTRGEDDSTSGMIACHDNEADVWDERLDRDYQALLKTMKRPDADRVRDIEQAWIAFRGKKCGYHRPEDDGEVGTILNAHCYLEETARQALFLHDIVETRNSRK